MFIMYNVYVCQLMKLTAKTHLEMKDIYIATVIMVNGMNSMGYNGLKSFYRMNKAKS